MMTNGVAQNRSIRQQHSVSFAYAELLQPGLAPNGDWGTLSGAPVCILELVQGLGESFQLAVQAVIEGCHHSAREAAVISCNTQQQTTWWQTHRSRLATQAIDST